MRNSPLPTRFARTGCSVLALATVLVVGASPAAAQSFLGSGSFTVNGGGVASIGTAPNLTTISVNPGQTVIDWSPTDVAIGGGAINFQPAGTTANFLGTGNYAVLNRINPADSTRAISMSGTIQSLALGAAAAANGSLYFYTPGGFVIGASAVINVGSLVLSASPITVTAGSFINGAENTVVFGQATQAGAIIATNAGSQINATAGDAYVAMVAPRVQHNGIVTVAGSAALVAAEAATISFSPDGLFDIQVTTGTTDNEGLEVNGTITGSAGGAGDHHRAYLVAVPKNSLLTMTIGNGANLGFAVADSADVVGNTVVLSAGHDISNGAIAGVSAGSTGAGAIANLDVRDSIFTSAMIGEATGYAHLSGFSALKFFSSVDVHAGGEVLLSTQLPGGSVDIDGSLSLSTRQFGFNDGEDVTSSRIHIFNLNGGTINVDGATNLNTDAWGGFSGVAGVNGGDATAGNINVMANGGGSIALLGGLTTSSDGRGGGVFAAGVDGGVGTGGQVLLRTAGAGSTLTVNNGVAMRANGYGGSGAGGECFSCDGDGGNGQGGDIRIIGQSGTGSSLTITGPVTAIADGFGGDAGNSVLATAGTGQGGKALLYVGTGNTTVVNNDVYLKADGEGGDHSAGDGGDGIGGEVGISEEAGATSGSITIFGRVELSSDGLGGDSAASGARGGDGFGGTGSNGVYIYSDGASITTGEVILGSSGTGGNNFSGIAGDGYGGEARVTSLGSLTLNDGLDISVTALGGDGQTGGDAFAGDAYVRAQSGGVLDLQGAGNFISATGVGGDGNNGNGGTAIDTGDVQIQASGVGSSITASGSISVSANSTGGNSNGAVGGAAFAGEIDVYAENGGSLQFDSNLTVRADAQGGAGVTGGGNAQGGDVNIYSLASLQVDGALNATALATGGLLYSSDFIGFSAGDATGGIVHVYAQNGLLTLVGPVSLSTNAIGGTVNNFGDFAGDGTGGETWLFGNVGGIIDVQSTLDVTAIGSGGGSDYYSSGIGGNGTGGSVRVQATAANSSVTIAGAATLDASGEGSGSSGGNGTGGTAWADSFGAATASLDFLSDVSIYAQGSGGDSNNGNGGIGQGGEALLQASAGSSLTVGGSAIVNSDAFGGYSYDFSDGVGGDALGGTARIQAFNGTGTGGTIDIEGSATVSANGSGGDSYSYVDGTGGNGTGGLAQLYATPGPVTIGSMQTNGGASVSADGYGGNAENGTGGNGTGGTLAEIAAVNGDMAIAGFASVSASGYGGSGLFGGDGLGSGDTSNANPALWTGGAHIYAQNGDIVINGGAGVSAVGSGGDGGFDNNGYNGDHGGDGGDGTGGWATIHAANSNLGPSSISINSGSLEGSGYATVDVRGLGGDGGDGASGNAGGDGGNGGNGIAGTGIITAAAGNGTLNIGVAEVDATALGGNGGQGGNGDGLPGGNGGDGGNAIGGTVNIGSESGSGQSGAVNIGVGNYGSIIANASAFGGLGGDGNFGSVSGDGGNGGNATGGGAVLLVRGSLVEVDNVTLTANATGGDGGLGDGETSLDGNGGNATVGGDGGIAAIVTGRFLIPTQRGTLDAGTITGTAIATEGVGSIDGISQSLGGNGIFFSNADGNIGSLSFLVQADTLGAGAVPDLVVVRNATVTGDLVIDGAFSFVTSGNLSLFLDNGDLVGDSITWHAADFVPDVQYGTPAVGAGTFFARVFDIQTGNNFLTTAHLDSIETLSIIAPGAIQIGNVTGDADIVLEAQSGEIDIGNILGGGGIDLDANDFVSTGNVVGNGLIDVDAGSTIGMGTILNTGNTSLFAGVSINVGSINSGNGAVSLVTDTSSIFGNVVSGGSIFADSGGDLFLGNLTAPGDIELLAVGDMLIGNALAGETIDLDAGGYVDGGNMTAGDSVYVEAGTYVDLLNISAGIVDQSIADGAEYNVGILAGTTIDTGDIAAANSIGLGAAGNIYTGSIDAGNIFLALSGGNMSFGEIDAGGTTYFANASMIPLGGDPSEGDFDPAPILTSNPVASGGSITLRGPVTTGSLVAGAGTFFDGGNITADNNIYVDAGTVITLDNLVAGLTDGVISGSAIRLNAGGLIDIGDATAIGEIDFEANGSITGGNITSGQGFYADAEGAIILENISVGLVNPQPLGIDEDVAVGIVSETSILVENIDSAESVGLATLGSIETGNITTGGDLIALAGVNMDLGTIDAGRRVYLANASIYVALLDDNGDVSAADILNTVPVATGGSIELRGAVTAGRFDAAAGTTLTGLTIDSGGLLNATSGGNMTLGNLFANNDIRLTSGANIVTGSINSGDDVALVAAGSISTLDIFAYDDVSADAGTTITTDDITGSTIDLFADGNISTGNLLTQNFFGGEAQLFPGASITVQSGGDIDTGTIDSIDGVYLAADGAINTGNIFADTFIETLSGGSQGLGDLTAGDAIELDAEGGITFGVVNAGSLDFTSGGAVTGGNITALSKATGEAEGAIVLGNITTTGAAPIDDFSIGIASATSILVGNASGTDRVGFATLGDLTTGNISAGRLFMALVGGDMVTGSITTAANGRVYIADSSMFETGGGNDDDFDSDIVLALAPVPTGGSVTINGPVITGRFQAAVGDDLATRAITANQIDASAGDNATLDGIWRAGQVSLRSGDINITANGGIDAGTNGSILLNAVNTDGPALIGDGLTGNGYALSNAEFGRISGGDITIEVGGSGGDADTLIGDLTITGPLAGSNVESSDGGVHFVTLQEDGLALDGSLRIVGDVVATGFGAENYLGFYTQNFELDAATGSISITGSGDALAGILELYASRIHVAEGTLLDQLAANPQFTGYREALNRPATVARPEGVINAASFEIEFGGGDNVGPYTLFVQNMGSTAVPAGFLLNAANISDDGEQDLPPGSIDMAINGQIIGEGGTLTGVAVRDLLVTEFGTEIFVAGSTINGCPLTGACITAPPPRIDTIVRTDVQINDPTGLGDGVDGSLSNPPNPLLDTDFLGQSGDVDDPVSGAGNPSLIGTSEDDTEVCDNTKDNNCKTGQKGDGK